MGLSGTPLLSKTENQDLNRLCHPDVSGSSNPTLPLRMGESATGLLPDGMKAVSWDWKTNFSAGDMRRID